MLALGFGLETMGSYKGCTEWVPVFVGMRAALGYDVVVGGAIVFVGIATGFTQPPRRILFPSESLSIAGVPMFSGLGYRVVIFCSFQTVSILYVVWYARRVKAHPEKIGAFGGKAGYASRA